MYFGLYSDPFYFEFQLLTRNCIIVHTYCAFAPPTLFTCTKKSFEIRYIRVRWELTWFKANSATEMNDCCLQTTYFESLVRQFFQFSAFFLFKIELRIKIWIWIYYNSFYIIKKKIQCLLISYSFHDFELISTLSTVNHKLITSHCQTSF